MLCRDYIQGLLISYPHWYWRFFKKSSNLVALAFCCTFSYTYSEFFCSLFQQLDILGFLSWKMEGWWLTSNTFLSQPISHLATLATRSSGWAGYRTLRLVYPNSFRNVRDQPIQQKHTQKAVCIFANPNIFVLVIHFQVNLGHWKAVLLTVSQFRTIVWAF